MLQGWSRPWESFSWRGAETLRVASWYYGRGTLGVVSAIAIARGYPGGVGNRAGMNEPGGEGLPSPGVAFTEHGGRLRMDDSPFPWIEEHGISGKAPSLSIMDERDFGTLTNGGEVGGRWNTLCPKALDACGREAKVRLTPWQDEKVRLRTTGFAHLSSATDFPLEYLIYIHFSVEPGP